MSSYNQIIKANSDFAAAHHVIKTFENGEVWQSSSHNKQPSFRYPLMFMEDQPSQLADNEHVWVFRVHFRDQVPTLKEKQSSSELLRTNYNEVKSRMIECAKNLISYWALQTDYSVLTINKTISITTVIDDGEDRSTGCYFDLRLSDAFDYNNCLIPMSGVDAPPTSDVTVSVNSNPFVTLSPGDVYNLRVVDQDGVNTGTEDTIGGVSVWRVTVSGGSIATTVNGGAAVASTDPLSILVKDSAGTNKGTLTTNTATNKTVTVADSNVSNSNDTYSVSVLSEAALELPDTNVDIYIDGVLHASGTVVTLDAAAEINISW